MPLKKTNGLYRGKVRIGVTQDGKPIDKFVSGKTVKELEVAKEAARDHFIYGRAIPKNVQFFEYAEQWYKLKKEPFISAASRASYKSCFMKHLLPEFGLQNLRAIDAAQIQKFVNQFAGASKSQITQIIGTLKGIFSSALAEGIIDRDPSASLVCPKAKKKDDRRPLTKEETERVLSVMRTNPEGLLLAVLYYLGVRRGEALVLLHETPASGIWIAEPSRHRCSADSEVRKPVCRDEQEPDHADYRDAQTPPFTNRNNYSFT